MKSHSLHAISPLDGRYSEKLLDLKNIVSEFGLIKYRVIVEIQWLKCLTTQTDIIAHNSDTVIEQLDAIADQFSDKGAGAVKQFEQTTNHDVKAVEYFLRQTIEQNATLAPLSPFIHFACTSEDINNLAYGLMCKDARNTLNASLEAIVSVLNQWANEHASLSMLSRTHGQAASPTTLGKEMKNVAVRLQTQLDRFKLVPIKGKCNGAVGNYNAHVAAYPDLDWPVIAQHFVESLGLEFTSHTTQIEPHDALAEWLHALIRTNNVLLDFARDSWTYISLNYFRQKKKANEVGSSTMPHKINPIDFENAEGNLGLACALANHLANKLPISRLQRDLSDSTVLRNIGVVLGHSLLAYTSLQIGISKLQVNETAISQDLDTHWAVLAEPIQTVLRAHGVIDAYEQLKALTRGEAITQQRIQSFIEQLDLPEPDKQRLLQLTPANYIGMAEQLAREK